MKNSCFKTTWGTVYLLTDSKIINLLKNYIGYDGYALMEKAIEEICSKELNKQFDIFFKDIEGVLRDNFKVKKKIDNYDNMWLANELINHNSKDYNNYYRNSLIAILKILKDVKNEITHYDDDQLKNQMIFGGEASFLHLLLFHINEFVTELATVKTGKTYARSYSAKQLSAQDVFALARQIPREQIYLNETTHMYESIFFIRQAIELRILELLCVRVIMNTKYSRPIKISPDIFIDILIEANESKFIHGNNGEFDLNFIKKAHFWTNNFIHSGHVYWFWEVEFIRKVLQDFIFNDIEIEEEYLKQIPEKILMCIKDEERPYAEVIRTKKI